jgi:hypothetical protein
MTWTSTDGAHGERHASAQGDCPERLAQSRCSSDDRAESAFAQLLSDFPSRPVGGDAAEAAASESAVAFVESVAESARACFEPRASTRVESRWRGCPAALSVDAADAPVVGIRFALFVVWA